MQESEREWLKRLFFTSNEKTYKRRPSFTLAIQYDGTKFKTGQILKYIPNTYYSKGILYINDKKIFEGDYLINEGKEYSVMRQGEFEIKHYVPTLNEI